MVVLLLLGVFLPPLINVNRYQRRIVTSISESLGRPVHLDSVALNILPLPGFTLTNFSVSEDPTFGSEPVIRANTVRARLRLSSLWRRKIEFSRISLDETSVNLVRRSDGQWNLESILLQAARIPAVPTEQTTAGEEPRFPYISATGARVNVKEGLEKTPISLTDTEFELSLARKESWYLRVEGHPARTNTMALDAGILRLDGTVGKATSLGAVPVDLRTEWNGVPLGAASWLLLGRDAGARGMLSVKATVSGTLAENTVASRIQVQDLRSADFVPRRTLQVDVSCKATAEAVFHRLTGVKCLWPPDAEESGLGSLIVTGDVDDLRDLRSAKLEAKGTDVPAETLVDVLRVTDQAVSRDVAAGGTLDGEWRCCGAGAGFGSSGNFTWDHVRLSFDGKPLHLDDAAIPGELDGWKLGLAPVALDLGGPEPAELTVQADAAGLRMRLVGAVLRSRVLAFGKALPEFGEGLAAALPEAPSVGPEGVERVDLSSQKAWGGAQVWVAAKVGVKKGKKR